MLPKRFLDSLHEEVEELAGRPGVIRKRRAFERCNYQYHKYLETFFPFGWGRAYKVPEKWAHRHGIATSPAMEFKKEAAEVCLTTKPDYQRGSYSEILQPYPPREIASAISGHSKLYQIWASGWFSAKKCISDIEERGVDEHGGWEQKADFDDKGRGTAINVDIYGIDEPNRLCVVQVRRWDKGSVRGYARIRKNYFFCGYNENGNSFAHSIPAAMVHAAIRKNPSIESPVMAAQAWIWGIKTEQLPEVRRNGDVALIPAGKREIAKAEVLPERKMRVVDSHWIFAKEIARNGSLFALDPTLRHMKGQHPTQKAEGWYKVVVANRAKFWDFARPTAD